MTISQTAEYALRAIVWLAAHSETPLSTAAIARATHVPEGYLSKVLQELARAGFVASQAGRAGGFRLTHRPEETSVLDIINAVDPIERIRRCPLGIESHGEQLCPLHRRLDTAIGLMERAFAESTIAELLSEPTTSTPLCEPGGAD